jgi:hypothetical protein
MNPTFLVTCLDHGPVDDSAEIFTEEAPFHEDLEYSFYLHYLAYKNNLSKEGTEETKMLIENIATKKSSTLLVFFFFKKKVPT